MANEFNIKNGFITSGNSFVYANLTVNGTLSASTISGLGYRGFKYNVIYYYGYFPPTDPATGQIVVIFYDDGEGGSTFGGISINYYNADNIYIGDIVQKISNQNVTINDSSGKYVIIPSNGTFTNFGTYSRIDTPYAYGNVDISALTGILYANFGTSNPGTVSSVAAINLTSAGTNITSTVSNSTTTPVITLNIPNASALNRGVLTTTDWTTFNNKQAALVSGTNIKTVNSTSLVGSGDVAVQPTLVSGTNIKTINGVSILGSGNISAGGPTVYTSNSGTTVGAGNIISSSLLIPANTVPSPTCTIEVTAKFMIFGGTSPMAFPALYVNTTNSLVGATLLASFGDMSVVNTLTGIRTINIISGTAYMLRVTTPFADDYQGSGSSTIYNYSTAAFTTNVNRYLMFNLQAQGTGVQAVCQSYKITIY
jgi:hypothetical protein